MQISISNLCEPGDNVINLWRNPGLTLTPSVRPCSRQPHPLWPPPDLPFPSHPRPHPPPPPEAFALGSTWLTAVDLDLSITRQIKEGFRAHSCFSLRLRSCLQSPAQTQFPATGLLQGPPNEVIPSTHDWVRLPPHHHHRCHRRLCCRHDPRSPLTSQVPHPPSPLSVLMWKQQVVVCIFCVHTSLACVWVGVCVFVHPRHVWCVCV